jgi:hypothetical protein
MAIDITALYCCLDDFCKVFEDWEAHRLIPSQTDTAALRQAVARRDAVHHGAVSPLAVQEFQGVLPLRDRPGQHRACFRELPHYDRFVSLMPRLFVPLMVLLHSLSGEQTGIYFADSTKLAVCHNRRIHRHKVFDGLAARGKTSMGWFYGLKLHFVINHKGQIMALKITPGNTADSTVLDEMTRTWRASSTPTRAISAANCSQTLAARPAPHHQHPAQHAELSDAPGRQDHAAQALRHRDRARYPQVRDGA